MSAPDKELLDLTAKLIFNISYDDCGVKLKTVIKKRSEALSAYIDQSRYEARLVELDLLVQAINTGWDMNEFKEYRLEQLEIALGLEQTHA
ncbi:hypothetical protein HAV21_03375 [Paenarthrobacter sp. MSM-2-10-13]|uniref:hypothetical protein n=1 Tax=Paenarthrobacter sp. MSM-2-10-13 TaxID=2717318 RepID=UPI00142282FD|nr:hypothetical protein [Paenarthrobacter sp. MSM-2-10-13]NHW45938.1 hypothetical protein [Paenarthrobacter sp. MSM-2-10-13]